MAKSLEEAAAENAAWQNTKNNADERWRRLLTGESPPKPIVLSTISVSTLIANFFRTHEKTLNSYITELSSTPAGPTSKRRKDRATALKDLLNTLDKLDKHDEKIFDKLDAIELLNFLEDAYTPNSDCFSQSHTNSLASARTAVEKLMKAIFPQGMHHTF